MRYSNVTPLAGKCNCDTEEQDFTAETWVAVNHRAAAVWRWDEGESGKWSWRAHTHTHTHTEREKRKKKENPLMGEMREGVGSVTAWLKDEGQLQWMSTQSTEPNSSTSSHFFWKLLISSSTVSCSNSSFSLSPVTLIEIIDSFRAVRNQYPLQYSRIYYNFWPV